MPLTFWPAELPQRVLREGYAESVADGRLISQMSAGMGTARRRTSAASRPVEAGLHLTFARMGRLKRFWEQDTSGGALPFIMPDQTGDGIAILDSGGPVILDNNDVPILTTSYWLVMFAGPIRWTSVGAQFRANFTLTVFP